MNRDTGWFKSTRSSAGSNGCVEVRLTEAAVRVRDSKNLTGPAFSFAPHAWTNFLSHMVADSADTGEVYNIGGGTELTNRDLTERLLAAT